MSVCVECPICMDAIDVTKNCVVTECGHHFHAKCLMQNVAHNGFDCPYCRAAMAEEVDDDDSEGESFVSEDEEEVSEVFSDRALFGMRQLFRMNSSSGEEEQDEDEEEDEEDYEEEEEEPRRELPFETFVQKFQQANITYEQLVKVLVIDNHMQYNLNRDEDRMMRRFYNMLDNFIEELDNDNVDEPAVAPPAPSTQMAH